MTSGAQYFGRIAFDDLQGERRYDRWGAYGQSKLANAMTALELQQRLSAAGSTVQSLLAHPGLARTNLQPTSVAARGSQLEALAYRLMDPLFQSAAMGALPQLYAATAPQADPQVFHGPGGIANRAKAAGTTITGVASGATAGLTGGITGLARRASNRPGEATSPRGVDAGEGSTPVSVEVPTPAASASSIQRA